MESSAFFIGLTFNEIIISILTLIIAAAVVVQAIYTKKQARIVEDQAKMARDTEDRRVQREKPNVRIAVASYSHLRIGGKDDPKTLSFQGFSITNTSLLDVTITGWSLELGIMEREDSISKSASIAPVEEFEGKKLSDTVLPHRLRYGETMRILFSMADLLSSLKREGHDGLARVRPQCQDSLGYTYTTDYWVEWTKDSVATHGDPGLGYLSSDEILQRQRKHWDLVLPNARVGNARRMG